MIDTDRALHNILQALQNNPKRYLCFGVWWWPVKALLKTRYTTANLYLLGDTMDPGAADRIPADLSDQKTLRLALEEYVLNTCHGMTSRTVADPQGEPYVIDDPDAGGI